MAGTNSKTNCEECGRIYSTRNIVKYKGKFLCGNCRRWLENTKIQDKSASVFISKHCMTLKEALNKTYELKPYATSKGYLIIQKNFPRILAGRKVKLVLVEDEE